MEPPAPGDSRTRLKAVLQTASQRGKTRSGKCTGRGNPPANPGWTASGTRTGPKQGWRLQLTESLPLSHYSRFRSGLQAPRSRHPRESYKNRPCGPAGDSPHRVPRSADFGSRGGGPITPGGSRPAPVCALVQGSQRETEMGVSVRPAPEAAWSVRRNPSGTGRCKLRSRRTSPHALS